MYIKQFDDTVHLLAVTPAVALSAPTNHGLNDALEKCLPTANDRFKHHIESVLGRRIGTDSR
jgi:hypothetical protein